MIEALFLCTLIEGGLAIAALFLALDQWRRACRAYEQADVAVQERDDAEATAGELALLSEQFAIDVDYWAERAEAAEAEVKRQKQQRIDAAAKGRAAQRAKAA